jgi:ferric-dicitrate binding protein FerR (iron transport regulator)
VVLRGEGYFEVARDAGRPFRVELSGGKEVTVLGTRFDVRDYADDPGAAATLLEGSVRVTDDGRSVMLAPEERATLDPGGVLTVGRDEQAEASIAWTKGLFRFSNTDLREVTRQLSRWYDVDVVFEGMVPVVPITASISRNTSAWEVLDALKEIAGLKYRVEGKRIVVMR